MAQEMLLTAEEAARRLSTSRTRIFDLIAKGDLASVKLGHSRRIVVRALEEYVARLAEQQANDFR
jgi:excisionase family DNA binding protein